VTQPNQPYAPPVPVAVTATIRDVEGKERVRLNAAYTRAIESVGLVPIIIPPFDDPSVAVRVLATVVAGLVLTGGEDVDPALYGQEPHPELGTVNCARDTTELALLAAARESQLPTLAICRGVQLVNVGLGGTLVQDLPSQRDVHRHELDDLRDARVHTVRVEPTSQLSSVLGDAVIRVNSIHHQAIDRLGATLRPTAWAEDGVIEAVETDDPGWWMLGVQWHPEELVDTPEHWDRRLLEAFASACRLSASRRVTGRSGVSSASTSLPSAPGA
jgi:putative glutamine amidotransferase